MAKKRRDPAREVRWRSLLASQGKSGLSVRAFCARERVPESAFFWVHLPIPAQAGRCGERGVGPSALGGVGATTPATYRLLLLSVGAFAPGHGFRQRQPGDGR